jgi:hypothetical protein
LKEEQVKEFLVEVELMGRHLGVLFQGAQSGK